MDRTEAKNQLWLDLNRAESISSKYRCPACGSSATELHGTESGETLWMLCRQCGWNDEIELGRADNG